MIRITIWNEFRHEKKNPKVQEIYPKGIHEAIASSLRKNSDFKVGTATLDDPEHGLGEDVVNNTDVLVWWGHMAHAEAVDLVVERCYQRILKSGMGLVALHSGHFSKIFKKLMGTTCDLKWREGNDREVLWVTRPGHPIVKDIDDHFIIDKEEMYGEYFDIPEPEETIMISSFTGGEVFRSLCTWRRGAGRVVYFRPGHETYPTYHNANVLKIIENAVRWAAPTPNPNPHTFGNRPEGWLDGKEKSKREAGFR
ncbi:trehalose utilization protein ThuA [soil metagenome]